MRASTMVRDDEERDEADEEAPAETAARDSDEGDAGEDEEDARKHEAPAKERPRAHTDREVEAEAHTPRKAAAWGRPLARLDAAWTKWEAALCAIVLLLEVFVLSLWVILKGLSTPPGGSVAGIVLRGLLGATVLGMAGFLATRKSRKALQRTASLGGVALGILLAKSWASVGVDWSSNVLNWFQQASTLTLVGGLRGVGTRLTLLLALLGGSLATASGKHITIDLITRFLNPRARLPVMIVGWMGSAAICFAAAWGFFDHIAIEDFGADADARAGQKISKVTSGIGEDFFIARKQIGLDFKSAPAILGGKSYSDAFTAQQWNEWLEGSGMVERYGREKVDTLKLDGDITKSPIISIPDRGEPRGELIKAANLVFPFGLAIIAIRFILLSLLALAGHASVDPEAHIEGSDIKRRAAGPPQRETGSEETNSEGAESARDGPESEADEDEPTAKPPGAQSEDDDAPGDDEPTAKPPAAGEKPTDGEDEDDKGATSSEPDDDEKKEDDK